MAKTMVANHSLPVAQRPHTSMRFVCRAQVSAPRPPSIRSPFSSYKKIIARRPIARGAKSRAVTIISQDDSSEGEDSVQKATKKYGLEGGLWSILTSKEKEAADGTRVGKRSQAKELLKQYGSAYLITSISLSLISFGLCYLLVSAGLDVGALLAKVGIEVTNNSEK
eukprot:CAMPEP_0198213428 /NCGR_PEP_ID=MMETSP1445-20131203/28861_1 /TAXON_ID=36898 /ORGANISM="Pyramimonas sp., Strain CCMP2087" /LENGTH=166 /DNA_ID=CAMNT_0043888069 /DNA_START=269 /DNA_END=766 /DNA_ORIENTATION=+